MRGTRCFHPEVQLMVILANCKIGSEQNWSVQNKYTAYKATKALFKRAVLVLALVYIQNPSVSKKSSCQAFRNNVQLENCYQRCRISSFSKQLAYSWGLFHGSIDHCCRRPLRWNAIASFIACFKLEFHRTLCFGCIPPAPAGIFLFLIIRKLAAH